MRRRDFDQTKILFPPEQGRERLNTVMFGDKSNTVKYNAVFASDRQAEQLSELEGVLKNNL